ncbi:hypothetical protein [Streptomyces zingiberis]|uniref:ATP-binding protein n=1 Tax=Streptomyces zingiberis TaxID=2053010 RepID=A0ABX1C7L3_9ACTN|nr:hypothetical protein [Streptomyces zingiberis]NJQ03927.1 hypothetical protein [Streptomyces zingiberis]
MPEPPGELRGRVPVLELVRDCLALPPGADRPLTVLLGPTGIGATDLLARAKEKFAPGTPCAYLNFDAASGLDMRTVLGGLARELERKLTDYKEPSFPRFIVGLLATGTPVDELVRAQARRRVPRLIRDELRNREGRYGSFLGQLAEVLAEALDAPPGVSDAAGAVLSSVTPRTGQLPWRALGRGIAWYGGGRIPPCADPADALVELNSWQHGGDGGREQGPQDVERVLLSAFLADLREHAKGWLNHRSFLVLLDNCHTDTGRRFLNLLLEARQEDKAARRGCDPLVTLASIHRWLPEWGPSTGVQWGLRPHDSDLASLAHWRDGRPGESSAEFWWYPLTLRPLRTADTRVFCAEAPRRPDIVPGVQRLTGGLPWAVRHTVSTLLRAAREGEAAEDDPYRRLRQVPGLPPAPPVPGPDPAAPTLAVASLGHLLEDLADEPGSDRRATLVRWSAARDLSVCARVFAGHPGDQGEPLSARLRERWLLSLSQDGRLVLHPWLRRLLLWELAADERAWRESHEALAAYYRAESSRPPQVAPGKDMALEEAYHRLALGETEPVAALLTQRFTEGSGEGFIRDLELVTSAPNRLDKSLPPLRLLDTLTSVGGAPAMTPEGVIRRLVVARWIWNDPLSDPGRRLSTVIAGNFDHLAALRGSGIVPLYDEAIRYRQWRDE